MDVTYKIIGGDGKEYGPVTREQIQSWVEADRVGADTQVWRSDLETWRVASAYPELRLPAVAPAGGTVSPVRAQTVTAEAQRWAATAKSGAGWFYWIAGLSLVNSLASFSGSSWQFIVGLGISQVLDAVAGQLAGGGRAVALALNLAAAGLFIFFGVFATRYQSWAFVVGMILYALDGLLVLVAGSWLSTGFHVFVLFCIFTGFTANRKLRESGAI